MPRTYPYDHFRVPESAHPAQPEEEKARVSGSRGARGDRQPRYGKRFAETEDLSHARQMNRQLEELARESEPKISRPRQPERSRRGPERDGRPGEPGRGAPIGAIPAGAAQPARDTLRDLVDRGQRHFQLLRHSVRDGAAAGLRLVSLPLDVAKLAARRFAQMLPARTRSG